ncbi:DUF5819 family protein [Streptomyces sp. WAC04114]|uniref:DUF5819 family protein n=1 Tax=Streptomyces sp. WAC04114 TaxID=2867961 RepID=UPI001C8B4C38|nr:DUF5819 family protein [Streptomyces sp. WAC04114]MBX9361445.1 hypothetical protein [Streptomyces sp. WAC04114]
MDAYDEGSNARHGPHAPSRPAPPAQRSAPAGPAEPEVPPGPESEPVVPPGLESEPVVPPRREPEPVVPPRREPEPVASLAPPGPYPPGEPRTGIAALSPRYQVGVALALAVVAIGVCVHIGMTFLHVAPANTVTREHGEAVDDWIYPEFEQNWKLFAPNPLQQNISIQVRAGVRGPDGMTVTTGWYDLSAEDGRAIDGNLLPSHTQQNELRRAWDFFVATHDSENRPVGLRGSLSESYLRRIMVLRLDRDDAVRAATGSSGVIERVQVRSRTSNVPPPEWSREKVSTTPSYRELPWWRVPRDEARGGVR